MSLLWEDFWKKKFKKSLRSSALKNTRDKFLLTHPELAKCPFCGTIFVTKYGFYKESKLRDSLVYCSEKCYEYAHGTTKTKISTKVLNILLEWIFEGYNKKLFNPYMWTSVSVVFDKCKEMGLPDYLAELYTNESLSMFSKLIKLWDSFKGKGKKIISTEVGRYNVTLDYNKKSIKVIPKRKVK